MGIQSRHEDLVLIKGNAAIGTMKSDQRLRQGMTVAPQGVSADGVDGQQFIGRCRHEHDTVIYDWRRFMPADHAGGISPYRLQRGDIVGGDLVQGAVAPAL